MTKVLNEEKIRKKIINDAKRVDKIFHENNGDKTLTRNFYRKYKAIKESYSDYFKSFNDLLQCANLIKEEEPKICRENIRTVNDDTSMFYPRKYFVTAAISGATLDKTFFQSVQSYCSYNNSKLILLPMRGVRVTDDYFDEEILKYYDCFSTEYIFNKNLRAKDFMFSPQIENPLRGLKRFGQKDYSIIVASPKQFMCVVPVSNETLPHILYSTGSITYPEYTKTVPGSKAWQDHCCGGLIVEVESPEIFHIRPVQSDRNGGFYDLDKYYSGIKIKKINAEAIVLGDIHTGFEDATAVESAKQQIKLLNPKYVIMHDLYDGHSISHHHINNMERQVNRKPEIDTLEKELNNVGKNLKLWSDEFPKQKFLIVRSNHDEFLDRYLKEARYKDDRFNHRLSLELAIWMLDGHNPLQRYIEKKFNMKNVEWLIRAKDYKLFGIQISSHGDKGFNGTRGSVNSIELSYGNSMSGHSHTPCIQRNVWVVGTMTKLRLEYNEGETSSWLHANGIIYQDGLRSLIISVNGKWRVPDDRERK